MRRHPKASSAGTTKSQGNPLGRIVRGELTTGGAFRCADGRGAPSSRRVSLSAGFAVLVALAFTAPLASAAVSPTVSIDPVGTTTITSAHVSGSVSVAAEGPPETYYFFQYSPAGQNQWQNGPFFGATFPETSVPAEDTLTNLSAATSYDVRLIATNFAEIEARSAVETFETDPAPNAPSLSLDPPASVSYTSAKISGAVDPEGGNEDAVAGPIPITGQLELNQNGTGWNSVGSPVTIEGAEAVSSTEFPVEASLEGLAPATHYAFRLKAKYAGTEALSGEGEFETIAVAKPSISGLQVTGLTATEAHFEAQINPNAPKPAAESSPEEEGAFATNWRFDLTELVTGGLLHADNVPSTVEADSLSLEPGTEYTITVTAHNSGGTEQDSTSFTTPPSPPVVTAGTNSFDHAGGTVIRGFVNPRKSLVTSCNFEYGPTESYGISVPCSGEVGSGSTAKEVTADISGLPAGAVYHFRVVADNGVAVNASLDQVFVMPAEPQETACSDPSAGSLPNCRAWEMVSPPKKNGGDIAGNAARTRASVDGNAVQFVSVASSDVAPGDGGHDSEYLAERTSDGWVTHGITPPASTPPLPVWLWTFYRNELSPDLQTGIVLSASPVTSEPLTADVPNLYLRRDLRDAGGGTYEQLTKCPACEITSNYLPPLKFEGLAGPKMEVTDHTPDFSHVVFESTQPLTPDAEANGQLKLYEWEEGTVRLVGIKPNGEPTAAAIGGRGGGVGDSFWGMSASANENDISDDGSRIFFTDTSDGSVNVRIDHESTVLINQSERTNCADEQPCSGAPAPDPRGSMPAEFWGATSNGLIAFISTNEQLINEDHDQTTDLYRYDASAPAGSHLSLISKSQEASDASHEAAPFWELGKVSADGRFVYFTTMAPMSVGDPNFPGGQLYVWHEGNVRYIGTRAPDDRTIGNSANGMTAYSRLTPDGKHFAFVSNGNEGLVGYDTTKPSELPFCSDGTLLVTKNGRGGTYPRCTEVYMYSYDTNQLSCVSCDWGSPPTESATFALRRTNFTYDLSGHTNTVMTASGSQIFFETPDSLVLKDTNGVKDVYEYDTATGSVSLVSSGRCGCESHFMELSPDGSNAFFTTRQQLVGIDTDDNDDLYDARVDGGIAAQNPIAPTECVGDACQAPAIPPNDQTPASESFKGAGNLVERKQHHKRHKRKHARRHKVGKQQRHKHERRASR